MSKKLTKKEIGSVSNTLCVTFTHYGKRVAREILLTNYRYVTGDPADLVFTIEQAIDKEFANNWDESAILSMLFAGDTWPEVGFTLERDGKSICINYNTIDEVANDIGNDIASDLIDRGIIVDAVEKYKKAGNKIDETIML